MGKRRITHVHHVADAHYARLFRIVRSAFWNARATISMPDLELLVAAGHTGRIESLLLRGIEASIHAVVGQVEQLLLRILVGTAHATPQSGLRAAAEAKKVLFPKSHPAAVHEAQRHAADLIRDLTTEQRLVVRKAISHVLAGEIPPRQGASMIRSSIGLSERQWDAVAAARDKILSNTGKTIEVGSKMVRVPSLPSADFIEKQLANYGNRLLTSRMDAIARTETLRAANEGQQQLWREAQAQGFLPPDAEKEWIASPDACDDCSELDGETVPLTQEFPDGDPPLHPNCRCTTGVSA